MTSYVWSSISGNWTDASNWQANSGPGIGVGGFQLGSAPTSADTAIFEGAQPSTVSGNAYAGDIVLAAATVTLNGDFEALDGQGSISDTTSGFGTSTSQLSTLTIGTWATVATELLQLANTSLFVDGNFLIGGGSANYVIVEGSQGALTIASTLTFDTLSILGGAVVDGNLNIASAGSLTIDDQSSLIDGTLGVTTSATLDFQSTSGGASEVVDFTDAVNLAGAAVLNIASDPGIVASLDGDITGSGTLATGASAVALDGTLLASGGSLTVGSIVGTGTLAIASGSDLILSGQTGPGLTIAFSAGATLTMNEISDSSLNHFYLDDTLLLPTLDVSATSYTQNGPDSGSLVLFSPNAASTTLTLLGNNTGVTFAASQIGSGSEILATPTRIGFVADEPIGNSYGSTTTASDLLTALGNVGLPTENAVRNLVGDQPAYAWYEAGDQSAVAEPLFESGLGYNIQLISPIVSAASALGPSLNIVLAAGYRALIGDGGHESLNLFDKNEGNSLLIGNEGQDHIVSYASGDTLVGASGSNTVFFAAQSAASPPIQGTAGVCVIGGGNDTISTTSDNATITTSPGKSQVILGSSDNSVVSNGQDVIICGSVSTAPAQDSISGQSGSFDTIFGPEFGALTYSGGSASATLVGTGGSIVMDAGQTDGNELWAGASEATYVGGSGSGVVIGGSQLLKVSAGAGSLTVFGGSGGVSVQGATGKSEYVVGQGSSTISAGAGNQIWVTGSAPVSVIGASGVEAFAGQSSGADVFKASGGSETLWGSTGSNAFNIGSGNGTFVCNGENNLISITDGTAGGTDDIVGFVPGRDTVSLHGYGNILPPVEIHSGSSFVTLGDGTQLIFYGVTNLSSSSFAFS